jgi:hypothetical protein
MTSNLIYDKIRYGELHYFVATRSTHSHECTMGTTHQVIKLKVLWKELDAKLFLELLKFEVSKILGKDISSVAFSGNVI